MNTYLVQAICLRVCFVDAENEQEAVEKFRLHYPNDTVEKVYVLNEVWEWE